MVDVVLKDPSPRFKSLCTRAGRRKLRQRGSFGLGCFKFYTPVCGERLLMGQLDSNVLFRCSVGLSVDDAMRG